MIYNTPNIYCNAQQARLLRDDIMPPREKPEHTSFVLSVKLQVYR